MFSLCLVHHSESGYFSNSFEDDETDQFDFHLNAQKNEDFRSDDFIIHEINEAHQIKLNCSNDLP